VQAGYAVSDAVTFNLTYAYGEQIDNDLGTAGRSIRRESAARVSALSGGPELKFTAAAPSCTPGSVKGNGSPLVHGASGLSLLLTRVVLVVITMTTVESTAAPRTSALSRHPMPRRAHRVDLDVHLGTRSSNAAALLNFLVRSNSEAASLAILSMSGSCGAGVWPQPLAT